MSTVTGQVPDLDTIPVFLSLDGRASALGAYQTVIEAWPVPHEDLWVSTSFGDTFVIASGPRDAPPIVLLHALFATAMTWYRNVEALSRSHRVYCVDVVGEANRSRPTRPICSLDEYLHWFTELIDALGIEELSVVGNSYGGFTAAYYAMKLPDRVRRLALIGPAATVHPMRPFMTHMFIPKAVYLAVPALPGATRMTRRSIDWMHAGLAPDPLWSPLFHETMRHGRLINRVFPRVYTEEELAQIQAPTMLVFGDREVVYGDLDEAIEAGAHLIPAARVAIIPDAHHVAALANPAATNEVLLRFLSSET